MAPQALDGRQPDSVAGAGCRGSDVQDFYERYPYPPPVDDLDKYRRLWQDPHRRRADYHLFWPEQTLRAKTARSSSPAAAPRRRPNMPLRWPEARVIGIDFSATSVRHTEDLKRTYNLSNLEVHQLPIERVGELETTFDRDRLHRRVCTIWRIPMPALRALRDVLEPDGAMHRWCMRRTGGPASTCCRSSAGASASSGRRGDPRSRRRARGAAGRTSAGRPAARGPGLPAGGGAGRCAAAPAGPRLFGAAAFRLPRRRGA